MVTERHIEVRSPATMPESWWMEVRKFIQGELKRIDTVMPAGVDVRVLHSAVQRVAADRPLGSPCFWCAACGSEECAKCGPGSDWQAFEDGR